MAPAAIAFYFNAVFSLIFLLFLMGTFVSILLGPVTGNRINPIKLSPLWIGVAVCLVAVVGWVASRLIPNAPPPSPQIQVDWNPLTTTWEAIGFARQVRPVFLSILAVSCEDLRKRVLDLRKDFK